MDKTLAWLLAIVLVLSVVSSGLSYYALSHNAVPSAQEIAKEVKLPGASVVQANLSGVEAQIADLKLTVNKDDVWKNAAENLAIAEYSAHEYKDIFNFLNENNYSIDYRADISSVVVKDNEVTSFDVDEKDADVTQKLQVKFENSDGDNQKVTLYVDTVVKDNEVDSQEFSLD